MRASGASWRAISREMGVGLATLYRAVPEPQNLQGQAQA